MHTEWKSLTSLVTIVFYVGLGEHMIYQIGERTSGQFYIRYAKIIF